MEGTRSPKIRVFTHQAVFGTSETTFWVYALSGNKQMRTLPGVIKLIDALRAKLSAGKIVYRTKRNYGAAYVGLDGYESCDSELRVGIKITLKLPLSEAKEALTTAGFREEPSIPVSQNGDIAVLAPVE